MSGLLRDRPGLAAVLVEPDYPELEFWYPVLRLRELGAEVFVAATAAGETYYSHLGYPVIPDGDLAEVTRREPDVVIVPGAGAGRRLAASAPFQALLRAQTAQLNGDGPPPSLAPLQGPSSHSPPFSRALVLSVSRFSPLVPFPVASPS